MSGVLEGRTAIVTGGASGIGAAVVARLRADGARVAILDRDAAADAEDLSFLCDVDDRAGVAEAVEAAAAVLGGIDVLVNNAGIGAVGDVAANDDAEWARVLSVNVTGVARVSAAALPHLRRSSAAAVCNMASIAATAGLPQRALYSASKGAVLALTRAMAADHVREGIRVNAVCPGTVDTPWVGRLLAGAGDSMAERRALEARQPHGRLVSAPEIAAAVAYLVAPTSGSTTGTFLEVDGGMSALRLRPIT